MWNDLGGMRNLGDEFRMKRKMGATLRVLGAAAWIGAAGLSQAEDIQHSPFGKVDQWIVRSPTVTMPQGKFYDQIRVGPGDRVLVAAGGCVQTGGHGKSWKRYVDPRGRHSDRRYHGLIAMPGLAEMRIQDFLHQYQEGFVTPAGTAAPRLWLGYEDESYRHHGYGGHDDGTGKQCRGVENAWVSVTMIHP
jgi:hypothetical protein